MRNFILLGMFSLFALGASPAQSQITVTVTDPMDHSTVTQTIDEDDPEVMGIALKGLLSDLQENGARITVTATQETVVHASEIDFNASDLQIFFHNIVIQAKAGQEGEEGRRGRRCRRVLQLYRKDWW